MNQKDRILELLRDTQGSGDVPVKEVCAYFWASLREGVLRKDSPWRSGVFCSAGNDGVEARTVVLRSVCSESASLRFFTDRRSPKVEQIGKNPQIAWVFYDPAKKIQFRLKGAARACNREESMTAWQEVPERARRDYATIAAPGTTWSSGFLASGVVDSETKTSAHFCVVKVLVDSVDLLFLLPDGHLRACIHKESGGEWRAALLVP